MNPSEKVPLSPEQLNQMIPSWFDLSRFPVPDDPIEKSETEWQNHLSDEAFHVLRSEGTEAPFRNAYHSEKKEGVYVCRACRNPLFTSSAKYDSGTGWPSFWVPFSPDRVDYTQDKKLVQSRTEVRCRRCQGHLGHVFEDGPPPTGLRYCMNSVSLFLIDEEEHTRLKNP